MSLQLRRRMTTVLAVLATALSSVIGLGVVTATSAHAAGTSVWENNTYGGFTGSYTYQNSSYGSGYCSSYPQLCTHTEITQRFTPSASGLLAKVRLVTDSSRQLTGTVEVRSAESFPYDGATLLSTNHALSYDANAWNGVATFAMNAVQLNAGTTYEIVLRTPNDGTTNAVYLSGSKDGTAWGYVPGVGWADTGSAMMGGVTVGDGTEAPTATAIINPASPNGANGWYTQTPYVTFDCQDDRYVTDCPSAYVVSDGQYAATSGTIHDEDGNSATYTVPAIKVDSTPPTATIGIDTQVATAAGAYNAGSNWYTAVPPFTGGCTGEITCTEQFVSNNYINAWYCTQYQQYCPVYLTGGSGRWMRTATDQAGNVTTAFTSAVNWDSSPGTIVADHVTGLNAAGWSNGTGTSVFWTCTAGTYAVVSSCAGAGSKTDVSDETGPTGSAVVGTLTDSLGAKVTATVNVKVDKTAPTISPAITGTLGDNGWYTSPVSVAWNCADAVSGVKSCTSAVDTFTDQAGTSVGAGTDLADNAVSGQVSVKSDSLPPVVTGTVLTAVGAGGLYDSDITVHWTCSDPGLGDGVSGVAACPGDTTVTGLGDDTHATASVADLAGNTTDVTVDHLVRRVASPVLVPPTISIAGVIDGTVYPFGTSLSPTCTATDVNGAPVACSGVVAANEQANGGVAYTFTATSTDPATNAKSSKAVSWSTAAPGQPLITGLPKATHSGKHVLRAGKSYLIRIAYSGSPSSSADMAPYWLRPVLTDAAGKSGNPTAVIGRFRASSAGSYVIRVRPTKAMHNSFRKLGVSSADGTVVYLTIYIK